MESSGYPTRDVFKQIGELEYEIEMLAAVTCSQLLFLAEVSSTLFPYDAKEGTGNNQATPQSKNTFEILVLELEAFQHELKDQGRVCKLLRKMVCFSPARSIRPVR